jgi:Na+/phosphate symporter
MKSPKKQTKMTLDRVAATSQREFRRLEGKIDLGRAKILSEVKRFKEDVVDEVRKETIKLLESNDKVVTRFDRLLKEDAAHTERHRRVDDKIDEHDHRIKKLERVK